jgi:signal transduction histidine kinase
MDDGKGFALRDARHGLGLLGMEERATFLGGSWRIDAEPGAGTRISLEIPLGAGA